MTKIYKQLNLFLFISNLCEWHFSCRKSFNKIWSLYPSPLSELEKTTLKNFIRILKKYDKKYREHLTIEFVKNRSIDWQDLSTRISDSDIREIKKAFHIFRPRFEYFYARQKRNMIQVAALLEKSLEKNTKIFEEANTIYQNKKSNVFDVLVCLSQNANQAAGGMYFSSPRKGHIVMQFGDFDLSGDTQSLFNVLYHEISHHFQNISQWNKLVKKYKDKVLIPKNYSDKGVTQSDIIDEITNASLWGEFGVLSQKAFSIPDSDLEKKFKRLPTKNRKYYDQIKWCTYKFRPIMQRIISDDIPLSGSGVLQAIDIWNTNLLRNKSSILTL